jgi:predicted nucleotidyltransferase
MLEQNVLATIQYFDVQDHALTLLEISKYVLSIDGASIGHHNRLSLSVIEQVITEKLSDAVELSGGFYVLRGRSALVEKRLKNNFYANKRLKRAKKYLPFARFIPFITAVALSGSEALSNSKKGSDIDLLVFTKPRRMWLGRISMIIFFQALGMRRYSETVVDRFCLNHFIAGEKTLDLDQNLYTAVEYVSLIPFFGGTEIYAFQQKNLSWIKNYLVQPEIVPVKTKKAAAIRRIVEACFANPFGDFLERFAARAQKIRIRPLDYILVQTDELSFHPGSKGQQVLKKFTGI